jgi:hypothetical protein
LIMARLSMLRKSLAGRLRFPVPKRSCPNFRLNGRRI